MNILRSLVMRTAPLLVAAACGTAAAADFAGRGVHGFKSGSGCPFPALSGEAAECNRVALDDADTRATIDVAARTIRFANTRRYAGKTVVGDVVLQGSGQASNGQRVPLTFHVLLSRSGEGWSVSSHAHAPVDGRFTAVQIDPYQISVSGPKAERVVVTPAQVSKALTDPSLAAKLANELVQVRDSRGAAAKDGDITVGLGVGKATKWVARARFHTEPAAGQNLDQTLNQGTWALELGALTGQIPHKVAKRELFLYGLEGQSLLQPLLARGFAKNERLIIGAADGKGYVSFRRQAGEFRRRGHRCTRLFATGLHGLVAGLAAPAGANQCPLIPRHRRLRIACGRPSLRGWPRTQAWLVHHIKRAALRQLHASTAGEVFLLRMYLIGEEATEQALQRELMPRDPPEWLARRVQHHLAEEQQHVRWFAQAMAERGAAAIPGKAGLAEPAQDQNLAAAGGTPHAVFCPRTPGARLCHRSVRGADGHARAVSSLRRDRQRTPAACAAVARVV